MSSLFMVGKTCLSDGSAIYGGSSSGPTYGPEIWPQTAFDASAGLTLMNATIASGELVFGGTDIGSQRCTITTMPVTLVAGETWHYEIEVTSTDENEAGFISIGGTASSLGTTTGLKTGDVVIAASNQIVRIQENVGDGAQTYTSCSIKKKLS